MYFSSIFLFLSVGSICSFLNHPQFFHPNQCSKSPKSAKTPKTILDAKRDYHISGRYYEEYIKRLNSKNISIQSDAILGNGEYNPYTKERENYTYLGLDGTFVKQKNVNQLLKKASKLSGELANLSQREMEEEKRMIEFERDMRKKIKELNYDIHNNENENEDTNGLEEHWKNQKNPKNPNYYGKPVTDKSLEMPKETKSKNFEVVYNYGVTFKDIGGYENIKQELGQCVDILRNYTKYSRFNVRIPKGMILEGQPGNGKTLLAKGLAGESGCGFISVSGSDFQEKYVGVGPTRIKEMFALAKEHVPCIIFIDEIDALGRKRSSDGESASNERDNTLNALLVEMDGFKNNTGIFVLGATNRVDLLDSALTRPGRIDKKIYIGFPDKVTREAILGIHILGKPHDSSIQVADLVEMTEGYSGAQIENLLNEAMLHALRENRFEFNLDDFDLMLNKMIAGWQPVEHRFSPDMIDRISIHEMGHAIVGLLSKHHSKMSKVIINLSSPKMPGYTVFESSLSQLYKREALFEHLMILLSGRIAEEVVYDVSVTTGAINDFEEALKLAEKMVVYYGMGKSVIYPSTSEKYKEKIDDDVKELINNAYKCAQIILTKSRLLILESSEILRDQKIIKSDTLLELMNTKYPKLLNLKTFE
jgi:ATP-dependent metalloprotease FtsH